MIFLLLLACCLILLGFAFAIYKIPFVKKKINTDSYSSIAVLAGIFAFLVCITMLFLIHIKIPLIYNSGGLSVFDVFLYSLIFGLSSVILFVLAIIVEILKRTISKIRNK